MAAEVRAEVEAQVGGKLQVYAPNADEDAAHWCGGAVGGEGGWFRGWGGKEGGAGAEGNAGAGM